MLRIIGVIVCACSVASATTAWGTTSASEMASSRLESFGQITEFDSPTTGLEVDWSVIDLGGGSYQYTYTLYGSGGSGLGVSHFALELGSGCASDPGCVTNATLTSDVDGTTTSFPSTGAAGLVFGPNTDAKGDTNYPGSFFGVRFFLSALVANYQLDPSNPTIIQFDSDQAPVYGDFYLKLGKGGPSGNGDSFWNNGSNGPTPDSSNATSDYIAIPGNLGAIGPVPEPGSFVLLGAGLIGLGALRRNRARQSRN